MKYKRHPHDSTEERMCCFGLYSRLRSLDEKFPVISGVQGQIIMIFLGRNTVRFGFSKVRNGSKPIKQILRKRKSTVARSQKSFRTRKPPTQPTFYIHAYAHSTRSIYPTGIPFNSRPRVFHQVIVLALRTQPIPSQHTSIFGC